MTIPKLCLNMIVKNEAHVIRECLDSVLPYISAWAICDTGSTDGTQRIIIEHFQAKGIPGDLSERPWKNFGHNRTEALQLARGKAQYIWVMDADDLLHGTPDFRALTRDAYMLRFGPDLTYWRQQVFRDGPEWKYVGVVHEYPTQDKPYSVGQLPGNYHLECRHIGARSKDPEKYRKDAAVLEEALKSEPGNARYWFYLGQSWYSAREYAKARDPYVQRTTMGGWSEELFYTNYRIGLCHKALGEEAAMFHRMLLTYEQFPSRAEPLYVLADHCMKTNRHRLGYQFAAMAVSIPTPTEGLFVEADVYEWRLLDVMAVCGYYVERKGEALKINERLLKIAPTREHARIQKNLAFCKGTA